MNQHVPRILSWNTTNQCNLKCSHCYMDAKETEGRNELSTEEGKRLMDQIANVSKCILVLSGGEPLLRPDIFELAEHGRSKGLRMRRIRAVAGMVYPGEERTKADSSASLRNDKKSEVQ